MKRAPLRRPPVPAPSVLRRTTTGRRRRRSRCRAPASPRRRAPPHPSRTGPAQRGSLVGSSGHHRRPEPRPRDRRPAASRRPTRRESQPPGVTPATPGTGPTRAIAHRCQGDLHVEWSQDSRVPCGSGEVAPVGEMIDAGQGDDRRGQRDQTHDQRQQRRHGNRRRPPDVRSREVETDDHRRPAADGQRRRNTADADVAAAGVVRGRRRAAAKVRAITASIVTGRAYHQGATVGVPADVGIGDPPDADREPWRQAHRDGDGQDCDRPRRTKRLARSPAGRCPPDPNRWRSTSAASAPSTSTCRRSICPATTRPTNPTITDRRTTAPDSTPIVRSIPAVASAERVHVEVVPQRVDERVDRRPGRRRVASARTSCRRTRSTTSGNGSPNLFVRSSELPPGPLTDGSSPGTTWMPTICTVGRSGPGRRAVGAAARRPTSRPKRSAATKLTVTSSTLEGSTRRPSSSLARGSSLPSRPSRSTTGSRARKLGRDPSASSTHDAGEAKAGAVLDKRLGADAIELVIQLIGGALTPAEA